MAEKGLGRTALFLALQFPHWSSPRLEVVSLLMGAVASGAALQDLCSANTVMSRRLLPGFLVRTLPLSDAEWALIPAPWQGPSLSCVLPGALAKSHGQARQLVRRLPPLDSQRLRTFALCVGRMQRLAAGPQPEPCWPLELPSDVVHRILSMFDTS